VNDGSGRFEDAGTRSDLRPRSFGYSGFGGGLVDLDNDGRLDALIVNGAVRRLEMIAPAAFPYGQRKQMFRNIGGDLFDEISSRVLTSDVGRGVAFGDIDNDGDVDLVVAHNNGTARLLINTAAGNSHWVGIRLVRRNNRPGVGSRVAVVLADGSSIWRYSRSDGSYASASDPRVLVGLGTSSEMSAVRVVWPDGATEQWTNVAVDRWTTLMEGSGR
jgi:hypothetical protein